MPTNEYAGGIPYGEYKWLEVIEDEPFKFVAFDDETGKIIDLDQRDVACYQLDFAKLAESLCLSAGFEQKLNAPPSGDLVQIGTDCPRMGYSFPVFLVRGPLDRTLMHLVSRDDCPSILCRFVERDLSPFAASVIRDKGSLLMALETQTNVSDEGAIVFSAEANQRIENFCQSHLPNTNAAQPAICFPTPTACGWSDVVIRFVDGETVSISAGRERGNYLYAQMGLVDARNGRPNKQWELLRAFADGRGLMTWQSAGAHRKNKKRRENLSASLRDFFRIPGEPIELTEDGKGWRTAFQIEGED